MTTKFSGATTLALSLVTVAFFVYLFSNLSVGYELGDHGFYLLLLDQPKNIEFTLTHFGLVWNLLIGNHGIVLNRAINITFYVTAFATLSLVTAFIFNRKAPRVNLTFHLAISFAAASSYFSSFILDPSYNSLSICLLIFGVALIALGVEAQIRGNQISSFAIASVLGFLLACLALTKASSALVFAVYALSVLIILTVDSRSTGLFFKLSIFALFGIVIFFGSLHLTTGLVGHVYQSFEKGLAAYSSGGTHSVDLVGLGAVRRIYHFIRDCVAGISGGGWIIAIPVLFALALPTRFYSSQQFTTRYAALLTLYFIFVLLLILGQFTKVEINKLRISIYSIGLLLSLVFWPRRLSLPEKVLFTGSVLAPFFAVYGTENTYVGQILFYGVAWSLPVAGIAVSISASARASIAKQIIIVLAGLSVVLSWVGASNNPYKLAGTLDDAKTPVRLVGGDTLHLTPPVEYFVTGLQVHAYQAVTHKQNDRPVVFDLTGQLPISVYLLNGQAPGAAWLMDAFGSTFSQTVFAALDDHSLQNGWVLVRLDTGGEVDRSAPHFISFVERINSMGKTFEESYQRVAVLRAPYWGREKETFGVALYKPRRQASLDMSR